MRLLLHLGPNVITDRIFITLGFELVLQMGLYYAWVQMLLQIRSLLHFGSVIAQFVPSTSVLYKYLIQITILPLMFNLRILANFSKKF